MHRNLSTLLELAIVGGGLTLAVGGCSGDDATDTTPTEDTDPTTGCPTTGCPTTGCPTTGCPTTGDTGPS